MKCKFKKFYYVIKFILLFYIIKLVKMKKEKKIYYRKYNKMY